MASSPRSRSVPSRSGTSSASIQSSSTSAPWWKPAWRSASTTDMYASGMLTYLPTIPTLTRRVERLDPADQRLPLGDVDPVRRRRRCRGCGTRRRRGPARGARGDLVDARCVDRRDHGVDGDVALQRDLALQALRDRLVAATDDDVGLDTAAAQLGHRVLRGLRLLLSRHEVGHQREVDVAHVVAADVTAELPDGLNERARSRCRRRCRRSRR